MVAFLSVQNLEILITQDPKNFKIFSCVFNMKYYRKLFVT